MIAFAGGGADWLRARRWRLDDALSFRRRKRIARVGSCADRLTAKVWRRAGLKGLN
jgi:hypothetical protein